MGFRKYEVLIRKNSDAKIDNVIEMFKKAINDKQSQDSTTLWAADIFDLRTLKEFMVFSDKSAKIFDIKEAYKTENGESVSAVLNLGQRILDVNNTIKNNITKNSDLITDIVMTQIPNIKNLNSIQSQVTILQNNLNDIKSSISELSDIKNEINAKIKEVEDSIGLKLKDVNDLISNLQKNISNISEDNQNMKDTIQKFNDLLKSGKLDEIQTKINNLSELQDKIKELEEKINESNTMIVDNEEDNTLLEKYMNNEKLTPEETEKLNNLLNNMLGNTQGYVL